jgi:hypothetical protein
MCSAGPFPLSSTNASNCGSDDVDDDANDDSKTGGATFPFSVTAVSESMKGAEDVEEVDVPMSTPFL